MLTGFYAEQARVVRHSKIGRPMSALGQKRTSRPVEAMSALPPIADMELSRGMSALCQKQTFCTAERTSLFDHLVGALTTRLFEFLPVTDQRLIVELECRRLYLS
jgi:hypothetical protein